MRKGLDQKKKKALARRKHKMAVRNNSHPWIKCQSGKMSYRTWDEADFAATVSGMYFYRCPNCSDFHLTESRQRKPPRT